MPPQKVLVPVDLAEETSRAAIRAALDVASSPAAVHVLHVVVPSAWEMPTAVVTLDGEDLSLPRYLCKRAEHDVDELIKRVVEDGADALDRTVVWGHVTSTIVSSLEEGDYDMVVLATRARTGVARIVHGSVAEKIVRLAPCPVLTVRVVPEASADEPTSVLRGA